MVPGGGTVKRDWAMYLFSCLWVGHVWGYRLCMKCNKEQTK